MRSDEELALALRAGDDDAFSTLYERYKRALYVLGVRMLGRQEAARDLVQDVFLKVYEKRRELNQPASFRSWLLTIGRNHCISCLRRERRSVQADDALLERIAVEDPRPGIEDQEDAEWIRDALARLSPEHREVMILREYQDLSYREIAQIIGTTEGTVKSRIFKARRALYEILKPVAAGRS